VFLLVFSIILNYYIGIGIQRSSRKILRKVYVAASVVISLLILSYFKYTYFFTDIINALFKTNFKVIDYLALWTNQFTHSQFDISKILLPAGISFFIFQSLSYTIDLYRKNTEPVKNVFDFGFYLSFFPQLVAGPIVRAADFIPQIYRPYELSNRETGHAMFLIVTGLIKKMIISDYISLNFVDRVFDNPLSYSGFENLMAVYGYSIQIYCDFSGYTDIAIGIALLLGFRIPINFNSPYKARNLTDFWRRWHISLSSWLRDYLYIPLGGNRKGKFRTHLNLIITMLLGGLWHGANIRFVIWGGIHGLGLVIDKLRFQFLNPLVKNEFLRIFEVILTFHIVSAAWIFFRATDIDSAFLMFNLIFSQFEWGAIPQMVVSYWNVFVLIFIGFAIHWLPGNLKEKIRGWFILTPTYAKVVFGVAIVLLIYQFKSAVLQPFIYFQF
jgi:D-alanyl-lipoteichoic acid acyltransferase DltB (MBOAT superfamily)